jgi:uncharacterized protein
MAVLGTLFLVFISARGVAGFFTDILWFRSLGFGSVFTQILRTKILLGLVFTVVATAAVVTTIWAADRMAPRITDLGPGEQVIMRYRELMLHRGNRLRLVFGLLFGFLAGAPAAGNWKEWLLFRNGTHFGTADPIFHKDAGFYVFQLPFISFLLDWMFATAVICLLVTTAVHYMNGGIRLQVAGRRVGSHVKLHLSLLLSILGVLKAAGYWFDRYRLYGSTRGAVGGPGYTDIHATLPSITLLMWISLLAVGLLLYNVRQRGWRLPIIAVGLWALVAFVAGQLYPAAVQRFQVKPAESKREQVPLKRNIEATRVGLGIDAVSVQPFRAELPTAAVKTSPNISNARILDQGSAYPSFKNLQALVGYYRFGDGTSTGVDVDRYAKDGKVQPVLTGVRELNPKGVPSSWESVHLAYTHGSGFVAAAANTTAPDGRPVFVDEQVTGKVTQPAIYVGEDMTGYSVVRTGRNEIDPPAGASTSAVPSVRYDGTGGVALDSRTRRAAFALRFSEWNLFGSSLITDESRIIYHRDVVERLHTLAPFLQLDSDPYAAVVDGKITWIVDAYTTTSAYPYGEPVPTTDLPGSSGLRGVTFNYIRNSVKATVDAYDGTVKLFVVDPTDPVIQTYQKIFPSLFRPKAEVPAALADHFRYPQDLFSLQTMMWGRYRIDDTEKFLQRSSAWDVAQAPSTHQESGVSVTTTTASPTGLIPSPVAAGKEKRVDGYYTMLQTPGVEKQEFVLLRTFVPYSKGIDDRQQLTAFMTASSEPGTYGKLRVYTVSEPLPNGPFLVSNDASQQFSPELSLLDQAGSQVLFGDLQLVPVGDALLWIRPWFLLATGTTTVPKLDSVTVTVGKRTFRGVTLDEALQKALGSDSVGSSGSAGSSGSGSVAAPTGVTGNGSTGSASVEDLLTEAVRLKAEADAALKKNPPSFDEYRIKSDQAYEKAAQAARLATGKPISPTSTAVAPVAAAASTTSSTVNA